MFTEAVFEAVLAEYKKEGIDVGGMTFEDNSAVVELIEGPPNGLLCLLAEECFFPNGSDATYLNKIKQAHPSHTRVCRILVQSVPSVIARGACLQAHKKSEIFSEERMDKEGQ